jgi:hypothetical protein
MLVPFAIGFATVTSQVAQQFGKGVKLLHLLKERNQFCSSEPSPRMSPSSLPAGGLVMEFSALKARTSGTATSGQGPWLTRAGGRYTAPGHQTRIGLGIVQTW